LARVEIPRALCVPGGLPPVCVVRGTQERVGYETVDFKEVVGAAPYLGALALTPLVYLFLVFRPGTTATQSLTYLLVLIALAASALVYMLVSLKLRPQTSIVLPLESEAFALLNARRRFRRLFLRGFALATLAVMGLTIVVRPPGPGAGPLTLLPMATLVALVVPSNTLVERFFVRPHSPRLVGPRGSTLTLEIPSASAAQRIREFLEGRGPDARRAPEGARCATHEGRATFVCARCGDFACATCAPAAGAVTTLCSSCRVHVSASGARAGT
jgi:hypothetical protein